jgi:hypothetical protein
MLAERSQIVPISTHLVAIVLFEMICIFAAHALPLDRLGPTSRELLRFNAGQEFLNIAHHPPEGDCGVQVGVRPAATSPSQAT